MDKINFTGSFLIKQPSQKLLEKFYEESLPKSNRTIVPNVFKKDNILVTVRDCYDREVAEYLLAKPFNFIYYPKANTKKGFDALFPKNAEQILNKERIVLKKRPEIDTFVKKLTYSEKPIAYKWHHNDHIEQTIKALKLNQNDCIIKTENHITTIHKKEDGRLLAKVSPNNNNGDNYVILYPRFSKDPIRYVTINYKSEITKNTTDINQLKDFRKEFAAAVKNDKGRVRPTKIA